MIYPSVEGVSILFCNPVFCPKVGLYLIRLKCLYLVYDLSKCGRCKYVMVSAFFVGKI
jgi:hypothetical protein